MWNIGSGGSRCCSDNHTPLRGEQQATIYDRRRCENNLSLIVLFGTWLSCLKLKFETDGFVKNIEIDGGAVMNSLIVTYMWVQMGYPTGVCGVRSQHLHETKQPGEK